MSKIVVIIEGTLALFTTTKERKSKNGIYLSHTARQYLP